MAEKKKLKFKAKYVENERLKTGGRKADSNYYRRQIRNKKIARISDLVHNTDQLMIVASLRLPEFKSGLVDRFLILAMHEAVSASLVVTKTDLAESDSEIETIREIYRHIIPSLHFVSNPRKEGLESVKETLSGRATALVGHSGTGKTTLLNNIDPSFNEKVQEISSFTRRGRHTTTLVRQHEFFFGGVVYDMPGLKEIDFIDISKQDLSDYYPEFSQAAANCKFNDCIHVHEATCGVKQALAEGKIHPVRYENYTNIIESLHDD